MCNLHDFTLKLCHVRPKQAKGVLCLGLHWSKVI